MFPLLLLMLVVLLKSLERSRDVSSTINAINTLCLDAVELEIGWKLVGDWLE